MQLTFGNAKGLRRRVQTRREIFLAERGRVLACQQLFGRIPQSPSGVIIPIVGIRIPQPQCCGFICCSNGSR